MTDVRTYLLTQTLRYPEMLGGHTTKWSWQSKSVQDKIIDADAYTDASVKSRLRRSRNI